MTGARKARGFTMLEVAAALTLLGVGLGILFVGYSQASYLEFRAAEAGTAVALARTKLAQVEAGAETETQGKCEGAPGFRWSVSRAPEASGVERITVTVAWEDKRPRAVTAWALVSDGT